MEHVPPWQTHHVPCFFDRHLDGHVSYAGQIRDNNKRTLVSQADIGNSNYLDCVNIVSLAGHCPGSYPRVGPTVLIKIKKPKQKTPPADRRGERWKILPPGDSGSVFLYGLGVNEKGSVMNIGFPSLDDPAAPSLLLPNFSATFYNQLRNEVHPPRWPEDAFYVTRCE